MTTDRPATTLPRTYGSNQENPDRTGTLLACGAAAGPLYLVVGLIEALTRTGFDVAHDDLSLLSNGPLGWIHITLLVVTGVLVVLGGAGLRRVLRGPATKAPWFLIAFGVGLIAAGVFVADPMGGFPAGTPAGNPLHVSAHGTGHFIAAALGFLGLLIACALLGRRFSRTGDSGLALYTVVTGVVFMAAFAGIATGSTSTPVVVGFWIGVILAFSWLTTLCVRCRPAASTTVRR
ncbi:MAG: hypothetical protein QOJ68_1915 [Blastococcus sp.]|jgi:hypothetical membrane protein|nr:hypothetical protein [Blastococcus sp.]